MGDYLKDMFIEVRETTQKKDDDILDLVYSTIMESATKPLVTEMAADKAKEEMLSLSADNERILMEAKKERDAILKEGREIKESIIAEAKDKAKVDAEKILTTAKEQIINEKMKAITELKNQVANLSIEIAEKILKSELQDLNKQKELVTKAIADKDLN